MGYVEMKQAPLLAGWVIGAASGLVAAGVSVVVMGFGPVQAAFVGAILLVVVGLILGLPRSPEPGVLPGALQDGTVREALPMAAPEPRVSAPLPAIAAAPDMPMSAAFLAPVTATPVTDVPSDPPALGVGAASAALLSARRPDAMAAARGGVPDDLKQIKGVGPVLEKLLHSLGFFHFDQVAAWTAEEVAWVDENLEGFKGRVTRDEWVPQAKILAAGGMTEHATRVANGEMPA